MIGSDFLKAEIPLPKTVGTSGNNTSSGDAAHHLSELNGSLDVLAFSILCGDYGLVSETSALLYPRTVGMFDPDTAEWVVIINSGWLE